MTESYFDGQAENEKDFAGDYIEAERKLRETALSLYQEHQQIVAETRAMVDADPEVREETYLTRRRQIDERFEKAANVFGKEWQGRISQASRRLQEGEGADFSSHLLAAAATPEAGLSTLLATAERTGQKGLAKAIAQVAYDRRDLATFEAWAKNNEEAAAAIKTLRTLPSMDRIRTRALAGRPPKAYREDLHPREADYQAAAEKKKAAERAREQSFSQGLVSITAAGTRPLPNRP